MERAWAAFNRANGYLFLTVFALTSCGDDGGKSTAKVVQTATPGALCAASPELAGCGDACDAASNPCSLGFYCNTDNTCTADCDVKAGTGCAEGQVCFVNGTCGTPGMSQTPTDAGMNICASVKLKAATKTPNVVLLLDQSGSMSDDNTFKDPTDMTKKISRWNLLKYLLIGTPAERAGAGGGFVFDYQNKVRFSMEMYSGIKNPKTCPSLTPSIDMFMQPALDSYATILAALNQANVVDDTPTAESIDAVVSKLNVVDPAGDPTIILLATDGDPDSCADPNSNGQQGPRTASENAVKNALMTKNIETFVIGISNDPSSVHLQNLANNGVPSGAGTYYRATDSAALATAFDTIIGSQISCDAKLDGKVDPAQACTGTVTINGEDMALMCNGTDGWKLLDETHLTIQGTACDRLKNAGSAGKIEAVFPCNAITGPVAQ